MVHALVKDENQIVVGSCLQGRRRVLGVGGQTEGKQTRGFRTSGSLCRAIKAWLGITHVRAGSQREIRRPVVAGELIDGEAREALCFS